MKIEVSNGEIFDKLSILEVKSYILNDERFRLKKKINIETGSNFHEQKGHKAT